ncbi:DUF3103 family protein [Shewanella surugensis]|uniref:DUF3103 domain-containing protein n=1 Tax=Shewanella surugensis TaxID=212020 RepID=A0ABT0LB05_9GAMM|nr:DUF3103 family protein [Shewanella surugensis]MCL1124852.1 DUF3103 domain-containing protein [Shewanella surugensis]
MKLMSVVMLSLVSSVGVATFTAQAHSLEINRIHEMPNEFASFHSVAQNKREIAQALANEYLNMGDALQYQINEYQLSIDLDELAGISLSTQSNINQHNIQIKQLKGISSHQKNSEQSIIKLRLADESMLARLHAGEAPLFSYASGDEEEGNVEAFDTDGGIQYLDAYRLPTQPVFIVELDKAETMKEGIKAMNEVFDSADKEVVNLLLNQPFFVAPEPMSMTVIKNIKLKDIKESWISGPAEVYAIISGVSAASAELTPKIEVVELPYLDHAKKEYTPNQIIVQWDHYRWQAVDILLMESDDNMNYKVLATALLDVATQVLQLIPEAGTQSAAVITRLTNAIIQAMPDSWTTNEDDYLDVFYTILENQTYSEYHGASDNAKITLEPLVIQPRH